MDASEAFDDVGHSEDARSMLAKYLVGDLVGLPAARFGLVFEMVL